MAYRLLLQNIVLSFKHAASHECGKPHLGLQASLEDIDQAVSACLQWVKVFVICFQYSTIINALTLSAKLLSCLNEYVKMCRLDLMWESQPVSWKGQISGGQKPWRSCLHWNVPAFNDFSLTSFTQQTANFLGRERLTNEAGDSGREDREHNIMHKNAKNWFADI